MCYFICSTHRPPIVPLITSHQITRIALIARIADAPSYVISIPQIIRYTITTRAVRASIQLVPVEATRRFPHRRTQAMSRTLRLLAELVEGPPVRTTGGTFKFLAREAFEQRVTYTITCLSITVSSIGTL